MDIYKALRTVISVRDHKKVRGSTILEIIGKGENERMNASEKEKGREHA